MPRPRKTPPRVSTSFTLGEVNAFDHLMRALIAGRDVRVMMRHIDVQRLVTHAARLVVLGQRNGDARNVDGIGMRKRANMAEDSVVMSAIASGSRTRVEIEKTAGLPLCRTRQALDRMRSRGVISYQKFRGWRVEPSPYAARLAMAVGQ